jgi:hypothetical protein
MRTVEEVWADAVDKPPFSNHTEFEIWAGSGSGCYDCVNDDAATEKYCPILGAALLGKWPREWPRVVHRWEIGDASGTRQVVGECSEFVQRPEWPGDDDPDDGPPPDPTPPPVCAGQVDMFEVFVDQLVEHVESAVAV